METETARTSHRLQQVLIAGGISLDDTYARVGVDFWREFGGVLEVRCYRVVAG